MADKKHLHKAEISFEIESDYEERPTEKEFLAGMLALLKHLAANPGQIYSMDKRTYLNSDVPMNYDGDDEPDFQKLRKKDDNHYFLDDSETIPF